jgi:hypothetical protein
MDILSALKNEASKLQKQLDTVHAAMKALGGTTAPVAPRDGLCLEARERE